MSNTDSFWWQVKCNSPRSMRQRVGQWLHELAFKVDGRRFLALEYQSDPPLSRRQLREVESSAVQHLHECVRSEVREECIERLLRRQRADLYRVLDGQDQ